MNITTDTLLQIENILKSAKLIDISEIIIDNHLVRGINYSKTAFILSELSLPEDFPTLGINRPEIYLSRSTLVKDDDTTTVSATIKETIDSSFISQLDFKSKSVKVQFRSCNPGMISAPKSINDAETFNIKFTENDVKMITKACSSIDTDNIKITGSDSGVDFELVDLSGDTIVYNSDAVLTSNNDDTDFSFSFVQKQLLQMLKNSGDDMEFTLGKKGMFKIRVNGIVFYLLPQV